jgi:hypothetical protein
MMAKPEYEFFDPTITAGFEWHPVPGDRTGGLREMKLAEDPVTGDHTRLLSFTPGVDTSPNGVLKHDVWEEVWILEGEIHDLRIDRTFGPGMYACRPPGMEHGPWVSRRGALTLEIRYRSRTRPSDVRADCGSAGTHRADEPAGA